MSASIAKVSRARLGYYAEQVAQGREDYYSGHGERPPTRAMFAYDVAPDLEPMETDAAIAGLLSGITDKQKIAAFDLTFSPPKSVSVLWALDSIETTKIVEEAHNRAVNDALASMQWYTRTGNQGSIQVATAHPEVALNFQHRTSRALDPQLHAHVLIANRVIAPDGVPRTIDATELYAQTKRAGLVYDATLRHELSRTLGVAWTPTLANGTSGEIDGIDPALIDLFSTRRRAIEAKLDAWRANYIAENGHTPSAREERIAGEGFTLSTREAKKDINGDSTFDLRKYWAEAQADAGLSTGERLLEVARRTALARAGEKFLQRLAPGDRLARLTGGIALDAIKEKVIREIEASNSPSLTEYQVDELIIANLVRRDKESTEEYMTRVAAKREEIKHDERIVELVDEQEVKDLEAGLVKARSHRVTTVKHLDKEMDLLANLAAPIAPRRSTTDAGDVLSASLYALADERSADLDYPLSYHQADAIRAIADSETVGAVLIGSAGVGKTTVLKTITDASERTGWHVVGLSKSAKATAQLAEAIGDHSTLDRWLWGKMRDAELDAGNPEDREKFIADLKRHIIRREAMGDFSTNKTLYVVDEASMAETDLLLAVTTYARAHGGRVLLTGDHRQLGAVAKGGVLLTLATSKEEETRAILGTEHVTVTELSEVVRQREKWERTASQAIHDGGNPARAAIDAYNQNGRIKVENSIPETIHALAHTVASEVVGGKDSVALAATNDHVNQLNTAIQRELIAQGRVGGRVLLTTATKPEGNAKRLIADELHVGDRVHIRRNLRSEGRQLVTNHQLVTLEGQSGDDLIFREGNERITLPKDWVRENANLGYALTTHGAQGMTVDRGHYLATANTQPASLYVGLSRGREENTIWTAITDTWLEGGDDSPVPQRRTNDPREAVIDGLKRITALAPTEGTDMAAHNQAKVKRIVQAFQESKKKALGKDAESKEQRRARGLER